MAGIAGDGPDGILRGPYPMAERFTHVFDPDKRNEYSAEHFTRDAKRWIEEIASGPNYTFVHRRRAIREALRGKAKKFIDEEVPDRWMNAETSTLDLDDGQGAVAHEPWEIILFLMQKNYGPDQLYKDMKDIDAFEDWKAPVGQRMSDIISDFDFERWHLAGSPTLDPCVTVTCRTCALRVLVFPSFTSYMI